MDTTEQNNALRHLLNLPPVEWPRALVRMQKRHKMSPSDFQDLTRKMDDACERLAFLSEYISVRFGCTGCGECRMELAVKHAQKQQRKVTAALGYKPQYRRPFFSSGAPIVAA